MRNLIKLRRTVGAGRSQKAARFDRGYEAHSPMWQTRNWGESRRAKLFHDRPYILGRLPKFILAFGFSMTFWSAYYLHYKFRHYGFLSAKTRDLNRRTLPFVQAMEDVRFLAVQERNYMILKAICDSENPELFKLYRARYHQEDFFLSYYKGSTIKNYYDGRFGSSRFFNMKFQRRPEDENYMVGFQEQSTHGG